MLNLMDIQTVRRELPKLNPKLEKELCERELKYPDIFGGSAPPSPGQRLENGLRDHLPREGRNGHWEGERGESTWYPPKENIPGKSNPENQTWEEILAKCRIEGIQFENGEPNFKCVCREEVTIEGFSTSRADNFDKADMAAAEKRGCTPEEVAKWRKEHGYTWHEMKDMQTMQKVPSNLHNNIPHSGGISNANAKEIEK